MKVAYVIYVNLLAIFCLTLCSCSVDSGNSALKEVPVISPKIEFTYPVDTDLSYDPNKIKTKDYFAPNAAIIIELNKPVNIQSVKNSGIRIFKTNNLYYSDESVGNENKYEWEFTFTNNDKVIIAKPKSINNTTEVLLDKLAVYNVILEGIKDQEGELLLKKEFQFVTKEYPDVTPPKPILVETLLTSKTVVIAFKDQSGCNNVDDSCSDDSMIFRPNDYINPDSIKKEHFILKKPNTSNEIDFNIKYDVTNNTVIFTTLDGKSLIPGDYEIIIPANKNGIKDLAGNYYLEDEIVKFTIPEPQFVLLNEGYLEAGVEIQSFSKPITTLSNGNFVIAYTDSSDGYPKFIIYNENGTIVTKKTIINDSIGAFDFKIAVLDNTNFVIIFTSLFGDYDSSNFVIYNQQGQPITDKPIAYCGHVELRATHSITPISESNFVISYFDKKIMFKVFNANGNLIKGPQIIDNDIDAEEGLQDIFSISSATLLNQNIVISYYGYDNTKEEDINKFVIYNPISLNEVKCYNSLTDYPIDDGFRHNRILPLSNGNFLICYSNSYLKKSEILLFDANGDSIWCSPVSFYDFGSINYSRPSLNTAKFNDDYFLIAYSSGPPNLYPEIITSKSNVVLCDKDGNIISNSISISNSKSIAITTLGENKMVICYKTTDGAMYRIYSVFYEK